MAKNFVVRFFNGFQFLILGLRFISEHSKLKKWALLPFLLAGVLFALGAWGAIAWLPQLSRTMIERFFHLGPEASAILSLVLLFLVGLFFIILHFYLVYLAISLIAAPFHAVLAEQTLGILGEKNIASFRFSFFLASILKTAVFGTVGIGLVLGSIFIPGLNVLSACCLFFIIAFDCADYALEALGYRFNDRVKFVRRNFVEFCGMAAFVGLTLFIPGLMLLLTPAAVTGSAILVFRLHSASRGTA